MMFFAIPTSSSQRMKGMNGMNLTTFHIGKFIIWMIQCKRSALPSNIRLIWLSNRSFLIHRSTFYVLHFYNSSFLQYSRLEKSPCPLNLANVDMLVHIQYWPDQICIFTWCPKSISGTIFRSLSSSKSQISVLIYDANSYI